MRKHGVQVALFAIDAFAALTAVGGGIALVTGLEGDRFSLDLLKGTPFTTFVVPGLILAALVGGSATYAAIVTLRNPYGGAMASALAGTILMGWIIGEVLMLNQPVAFTWVEAFFFAVGLTMATLGLALSRIGHWGVVSPGSARISK